MDEKYNFRDYRVKNTNISTQRSKIASYSRRKTILCLTRIFHLRNFTIPTPWPNLLMWGNPYTMAIWLKLTLKDVASNGTLKMLRHPLKRAGEGNKPDVIATTAKHPDSHGQISCYIWMQQTYMRSVSFWGKFISGRENICLVFTYSLLCIRNLNRSLRSLMFTINTVWPRFPWSILHVFRAVIKGSETLSLILSEKGLILHKNITP